MIPVPCLDLPEPHAAMFLMSFTSRFHGLRRIKEDLKTSPPDQRLIVVISPTTSLSPFGSILFALRMRE
jgi:hypothetical protein